METYFAFFGSMSSVGAKGLFAVFKELFAI